MRHCWVCGAKIELCNGFVSAGDFVLASEGKLPWSKVRETCKVCVAKYAFAKEQGLPLPFNLPSEDPAA
ncbi:MAG: hypothetical protein A2648_00855 [Candidatus Lloydbacteria bacterium RIFCSPHIGHO2_01_FULL_41_20]|uniref:Uncharacterized protein n=1 Tax=Candidatus Lloydbacteria bacterium RIFCSPHIGHO2_01_FULL_41_20 TaxID=1798657 RepID=A0A1G2CTT5_9BACT|nr:MAG: hypothetical protein A2648_00855 [Candidatus Lloydbacteria bacterium RIFCSPHIGHO2_01_FULL_41_20]